jgi:hypothetical protein
MQPMKARDNQAQYFHERRQALRQAGLCAQCKRPSRYYLCLLCRLKSAARKRKSRKRNES